MCLLEKTMNIVKWDLNLKYYIFNDCKVTLFSCNDQIFFDLMIIGLCNLLCFV